MTDYRIHVKLRSGVLRETTYRHLVEVLGIWDDAFGTQDFLNPTASQAKYLAGLLEKYFLHIERVRIYDEAGEEL